MHIAFLTNPASGQVNVQLATAHQVVSEGHRATFIAAESCRKKVDQLRESLHESQHDLLGFVSLGSGRTVDDFTTLNHDRWYMMRAPPGDPVSMEACIETALGPADEHAVTATMVRDQINALNPNMICVDVLTPPLITGVRLTNRKYILTIPCSPGLTALPGPFEPHPMASNRDGSWGTLIENAYLNFRGYIHSRTHPDCVAKHELLSGHFGLKSYGVSQDTSLLPPHWEDPNCVAGIHFNTFGLTDNHKQSSKMVFVGAGVTVDRSETAACPELAWMNEALVMGDDVVLLNMGSMFIWDKQEFWNCIAGFKAAYEKRGGRVRFIFKIGFPVDHRAQFGIDQLPPYIRLTTWIENQHAIYSHPALKVFIHHGGGNSFNEAVYFGLPQLVLSQWLDTHEYASLVEKFGLGLRSARPPHIDAQDIESKISTLIGPAWRGYKATCQAWAVRSQVSGGTVAAARVVLAHAEASRMQNDFNAILTPPFSPIVEKNPEELKEAIVCS